MNKKSKSTPVYLKSEFWMTVVTGVSGLLLAFGIITPAQSNTIAALAPQIVGALLALFSTSKFVGVQHAAKVEVFRAMCAMRLGRDGEVTAQGAGTPEEQVSAIAVAAGL